MPDSTLDALTAATAATGGLYYGTQGGADRKFTVTAAGATLVEAADAAAQRTALAVLPLTGGTLTGQLINSTNGAASTPPVLLSGTIFTGGSATTTKPQLLVEPAGTTSTGWNTGGTLLGANAPSGFAGSLLDVKANGASRFKVDADSTILANGSFIANDGQFYLRSNQGPDMINMWSGNLAVTIAPTWKLGFSSAQSYGMAPDTYFKRSAASVMAVLATSDAGASVELTEMTAPSAPAANKVRIYSEDNGSGKTRLMALFPSGAAQQIAIEP